MKKMFQDTKPGQILTAAIDIIWAGMLWILLCVPVITAGASCCALYHVTVKCIRRERGHTTREFFASFKANFLPSLPVWIIYLALAVTALLNTKLAIFYAVPAAVTFPWMFPYASRFTQTVPNYLKNAAYLSVRNIGKTLSLDAILALAALIAYLVPVVIPLLPGFVCLLCSFIIEPVFREITIKMENDDNEDKWYNE